MGENITLTITGLQAKDAYEIALANLQSNLHRADLASMDVSHALGDTEATDSHVAHAMLELFNQLNRLSGAMITYKEWAEKFEEVLETEASNE